VHVTEKKIRIRSAPDYGLRSGREQSDRDETGDVASKEESTKTVRLRISQPGGMTGAQESLQGRKSAVTSASGEISTDKRTSQTRAVRDFFQEAVGPHGHEGLGLTRRLKRSGVSGVEHQ